MRLWSLHPKYLDVKGLVALWREGLLALEVLKGATRGYRNHPQLQRFKEQEDPVESIKVYLWHVYEESLERGYHFNPSKIMKRRKCAPIRVTTGQLRFELEHLRKKLAVRDGERLKAISRTRTPEPHPSFLGASGPVEGWERDRLSPPAPPGEVRRTGSR